MGTVRARTGRTLGSCWKSSPIFRMVTRMTSEAITPATWRGERQPVRSGGNLHATCSGARASKKNSPMRKPGLSSNCSSLILFYPPSHSHPHAVAMLLHWA